MGVNEYFDETTEELLQMHGGLLPELDPEFYY